ncbi:unnamed protein product [Didymodactylos carnosus]|nr:unnamed protein product [Didymodactylos carnosus]CAF3522290.1 unnamed protein product [Didymodactylos carnosus]
MLTLGRFLQKMNEYDKAEHYYRLLMTQPKIDYYLVSLLFMNIGTLFDKKRAIQMTLNDLPSSLENYEKAISFASEHLPKVHLLLIGIYNNFASALSMIEDRVKALEYFQTTFDIQAQFYCSSTEHLDLPVTLNNIGLMYYKIKQYQNALEYFGNTTLEDF